MQLRERHMDLPTKVWLANEIRIWGLAAAAIVAAISFAAGWKHTRWQAELTAANEKVAQDKQRDSNEKISQLNRDTVRLSAEADASRAEIAKANEGAAKASAEALKAKLDLEKFRAPRVLTSEQQAIIVRELKGKISEINVVSKADVESREYRFQFTMLLRTAGLTVHTGSLSPLDTALLGNPNGVVIWSENWMGPNGFPDPSDPLYSAIFKAGLWAGSGGRASFIPDGKTELVVPDIPTIYIFQKTPW